MFNLNRQERQLLEQYETRHARAAEQVVRSLLREMPTAFPRTVIRNLLKVDPRVVAKIAEQLLSHLEKPVAGQVQAKERFANFDLTAECKSPYPEIYQITSDSWVGYNFPCPNPPTYVCLGGQAPVYGPWPPTANLQGFWKAGIYPGIGGLDRAQILAFWQRDCKYPSAVPVYIPADNYALDPFEPFAWPAGLPAWTRVHPAFAPFRLPEPDQGPEPVPRPARNPWWYEVGPGPYYEPEPDTRPDPRPSEWPDWPGRGPAVSPGTSPGTGTGGEPSPTPRPPTIVDLGETETQSETDGDGNTTYPPSSHAYTPPGRGVRERKVAVTQGTVGRLFGQLSEGRELIQDLWKSLPADARGRDKTIPGMLSDLWDNWDRLDLGRAISNIAKDKAEDFLIGRAAQRGLADWKANLPRGYRRPVGPQFGGRYTQQTLTSQYPRNFY